MARERKIGNGAAVAIIGIALIIDGIQALLTLTVVGSIVATFVTFIAGFGFFLWFTLLGVKYLGKEGGKKALIGLASLIAELVPFVNALPATTAGVLGIILTERAKELKQEKGSLGKQDVRKLAAMARYARMRAARSQMLESARIAREAKKASDSNSTGIV